MLLAAPVAVRVSANLPLSIALVWITNPITMAPIYYGCYKLGAWLLGVQIESDFVVSPEYIWQVFDTIWQPFLLGCLIVSTLSSIIGDFGIQLIYRYRVYRRLR